MTLKEQILLEAEKLMWSDDYARECYYASDINLLISLLAECASLLDQSIDGKTRIVIRGDTWRDRTRKSLAKLQDYLEDTHD